MGIGLQLKHFRCSFSSPSKHQKNMFKEQKLLDAEIGVNVIYHGLFMYIYHMGMGFTA